MLPFLVVGLLRYFLSPPFFSLQEENAAVDVSLTAPGVAFDNRRFVHSKMKMAKKGFAYIIFI